MNLDEKMKGFPSVYYFNLDSDVERKEYMETQFRQYGIRNYQRVSGNKFLASKIKEWEYLLIGDYDKDRDYAVANFVSHIDFLAWWLKNTTEETLIIMEDDYDLSLIPHWHFSWEFFMKSLPANWDCIQMGYEHPDYIIFCLHIKPPLDQLFGPCMLNRNFVKKIINLYYQNGKFMLNNKLGYSKKFTKACSSSVDTAIINDGVTYRIPLITTNFDLCRPDRLELLSWHKNVASTYHYWWTAKRDYFDFDDFFSYAHPNVDKMTQPVRDYKEIMP